MGYVWSQAVFQAHMYGLRDSTGVSHHQAHCPNTSRRCSTKTYLVQNHQSHHKNAAVSSTAPTRSKQQNKRHQLGVKLSGKSCLLTAKFVRHFTKGENLSGTCLSNQAWFTASFHHESIHPTMTILYNGRPWGKNAGNASHISKTKPSCFFFLFFSQSYLIVHWEHSSLYTSLLRFFCHCIKFYLFDHLLARPWDP